MPRTRSEHSPLSLAACVLLLALCARLAPAEQAASAPSVASQLGAESGPASQRESQPATQPESQPATQPSSQPASAPDNPLRSPARMIGFFDAAIAEGQTDSALLCMNFSQVDPEVAKAQGADYMRQLVEILARITETGNFDRSKLPDDPAVGAQTIGKDPLLLVLDRGEVQVEGQTQLRWRFSASTVVAIPEMHEQLDRLAALSTEPAEPEAPAAEPAPGPAREPGPSPFRSPYHLVEFFLVRALAAKEDSAAYVDAIACMDFTLLPPPEVRSSGPDYVDMLAAILARLRSENLFDREKDLPKTSPADVDSISIGKDPLRVIIARQSDGSWRFAAATVKAIPTMFAGLQKPAPSPPAPGAAPPAAAPAPSEALSIPLDTSSPAATMNLFLNAMNTGDLPTAVRCLDLSRLSEPERAGAKVLAGKLWMVLNRHKLIVVSTDLPSDPEHKGGVNVLNLTTGRIEIARQRGGSRDGEWLFSATTVASIDRLYDDFEDKPVLPNLRDRRVPFFSLPGLYIREHIVPGVLKWRVLGLQVWQWIGLVVVCGVAVLTRMGATVLLIVGSRRILRTETASVLPSVVRRALRPTSNLALLLVLWSGLQLLDLGAQIGSWSWWTLRVLLAIAGVHATYRLVDLFLAQLSARQAERRARVDEVLLSLLSGTFKVLVLALGFLVVLQSFGFNVGVLLAGLGLGGLAFGLAAQDTLKNFFGSINVVLDRPFKVGDWIKIGDVEGTVESVGLRSSRLRTMHNSELTVPNAELMTARIDNMGRRLYRRFLTRLAVVYSTTPAQLEAFCEGIRELIRREPYTRKDFYAVYVEDLAPSSISILLVCFFRTDDWPTEARERHRLLIHIMQLAERLGVSWAFPTQTIHVHNAPSDRPGAAPTVEALQRDPTQAELFGRDEAAAIIRQDLGGTDQKPPPVTF